jgi:signal transduction histidine kinase
MVLRLSSLLLVLFCIFSPKFLFPQEPDENAIILAADSIFQAEQWDEAIKKYQEFFNSHVKVTEEEYKVISEYYVNVAFGLYQLHKFDSAVVWFEKALELQKKIGDPVKVSNTLNNIGISYKMRGNYDKAIEYYKKTLLNDEEHGNTIEIPITYNNIGMVYKDWGKYDSAFYYFERSLLMKKDLLDQAGTSTTLNNIGLTYIDWKKYDEALIYLKEALEIERALNKPRELALRMINLGKAYFKMNLYDSALIYNESALKIGLEIKDQKLIGLVFNNIGKIYQTLGNDQDALKYLLNALEIYSELGIEPERAVILANLGKIYMELGNQEKAFFFLDSSTAVSTRINLVNQLNINYMTYSDMYSKRKDFEKSLEYFKKSTAIKDSVFTEETLRQVSEFQAKYEKEKDQAHILALEKENLQKTYQRNAYMFTGIGIILIAMFIIIYLRLRAIHTRTISEQKIMQLEEEKKLMAAKLLVEGQELERKRIATELHDGLGVLLSATKMQFSIIQDKSPENKELIEKAIRMLEQATGDVRKISHNMMPGLLTKLGFFEAVEDLFEHIGESGEIKVTCKITGDQERLPENKEIMLYRIVQEIVNNTIKYAQAKNIEFLVNVNPGNMEMIYYDDGIGFELDEKIESESIGLKSIQSRVNFLSGKLDINTKPGAGVKYTIQIPV